jgi:hypothetical protein
LRDISNSEVEGPHESIRIFVLEERKKGVQKQLGEVLLSVSGLEANSTVQNSYPITGDKGVTIGELRIRATYSVDIILPTVDYNELLGILIHPEMSVVRNLSAVTKEKSSTARYLIHVFQARDLAEGFIRNIVREEIERTDSPEVLFRGNTVCTKAMDHFMKLVGSLYQREVLMPIIEVICRETASLEVQKEKLASGDEWKKNLARLQKLTELLLQRIFQSVNHCPPPIRNLLSFIRDTATAKFKDTPSVRHTAVTSFIFLRFFVPAVLNPKQFGLTANMPSELHMRIFTLVAGILQKLANLTKYRDLELHINSLNPFLEENFPKTKIFIDEIVAIETPTGRSMQRRMSIANSIQIDVHLAGLVREFESCRAPLSALSTKDPHIPLLFNALDKINKKLDVVKEQISIEEAGLSALTSSSGDGLDSLLSKVIQNEVQSAGNAKVVTVKRSEEPLPEGATKARQRSGSFFSKMFGQNKKSIVSPSLKITSGRNGLTSLDSHATSSGARPPPSTPSSDFSRSPLTRSFVADETSYNGGASSANIQIGSGGGGSIRSSQDLDVSSPQQIPLSSSLSNISSNILSVRSMKVSSGSTGPAGSALSAAGEAFEVGSAPGRGAPPMPLANQNLDIINQHREAMRNRATTGPSVASRGLLSPKSAPPKFSASSVLPVVPTPISEPWFSDISIMSDIEAMEQQTDYHGLTADQNNRSDSAELTADSGGDLGDRTSQDDAVSTHSSDDDFPATPFMMGSSDSALKRPEPSSSNHHHHHQSSISSPSLPPTIEEEEEQEDLDDVVVVKLDIDISALEREFDILERIISDIQAIPPPPSAPKQNASDLVPELRQLERVVEELEEAVVFTTPKVHLGSEGLTCKFCLGSIDTGSRFLVVMGQNFHEGHLNCHICSRDLSEVAFQWYKEKSYCFDCYKKGHGIRPMCAHCNEPIMTASYTQALGKYWHPDHFCCTVCGVGFPDGAFYNFEGKPYCVKHQNRGKELPSCGMCQMPIADPNYIEALGEKWHSHHFCCDICGIQLVGQFVTYQKDDGKNGKGCESHFNT